MNSILIAITGPSGAVKSTLARALADSLNLHFNASNATVIHEDAYYRDQSHLTLAQRLLTNYDHPAAIEHELLEAHLLRLRKGEAVAMPVYDFAQHTRSPEREELRPAKFMIVEGILLFSSPSLLSQFDLRIFLNTPLDSCFDRRLLRDQIERGRTAASVEDQFANSVVPMARQYRAVWEAQADLQLAGTIPVQTNVESILRELGKRSLLLH